MIAPELDRVWQWFDDLVGSPAALSPRGYCRF
jgi:hypothetical protein